MLPLGPVGAPGPGREGVPSGVGTPGPGREGAPSAPGNPGPGAGGRPSKPKGFDWFIYRWMDG